LTLLKPEEPGIAAKYVALAGAVVATFWTVSIIPLSVPW
jgi:hypothetical protein